MGPESSPLEKKLLIPPPPHQEKFPPVGSPHQFFVPPFTKGSFPPLDNNFLNGQNHSSSDSHHPIKKSPKQNLSSQKDFPLTP